MRPWLTLAIIAVAAVLLALLPLTGDAVWIQFGINALLLATCAQAWNILGGFTGYVSFGNSVFYGLGTYGTAAAMTQLGWLFPVGLALGAGAAMVLALLLGIPILRLRGPYFAIATLGLSAAMAAVVSNIDAVGANIGLILPLTRADGMFYELALALLLACTLTVAWLARSRFGSGLVAIREDEDAAASMGVDTTRYKVIALVLSALFTAIAGGIHAYWITFINPASAFDPTLNVQMVIFAVFGGPGTVLGPVVGAFILSAIYEVLASWISTAAAFLFGLVIVLAVIFTPRGLADIFGGVRRHGAAYLLQNIRENRL
ncbi:MAG TPA: branched-chain amino acid ABC transporter permease [Hyphomicrobiales bacterium]|nr:branched-chain amino acid ABC transporter permease [Hyphomicrobiales bacterium]